MADFYVFLPLCSECWELLFQKKNPRFRKCYVLREELPLVFLFVLLRFLSNDVGTTSFSSLSPFFRWFILLWPLVYIFFFWRSISFLVATILRSCEVVQVIRALFFSLRRWFLSIDLTLTSLRLCESVRKTRNSTPIYRALFFFFLLHCTLVLGHRDRTILPPPPLPIAGC